MNGNDNHKPGCVAFCVFFSGRFRPAAVASRTHPHTQRIWGWLPHPGHPGRWI